MFQASIIIFSSLLFSVNAFQSSSNIASRRNSHVSMSAEVPSFNPKTYAGITEPIGFFDPLDFSKGLSETEFKKFRESELKHGRVAMLAVLGVVLAEAVPFMGSKIAGPAIYQFQQADGVLPAFTANIIGLTAAIEGFNIVRGWDPIEKTLSSGSIAGLRTDYENGNLNFDPLSFKPSSPKALATIKTKELNNGRLAMIAIAGIVAQELVTGKAIF